MSFNKKIWFILALVGTILSAIMLKVQPKDYMIRVGVSDDTSTLVVNHMMDNQTQIDMDLQDFMQKYTISDC